AAADRVQRPVHGRLGTVEAILGVAVVAGGEALVDREPEGDRFAEDPLEREVGQPVVDVAAADVRVHAREPALLERLAVRARRVPELGPEVVADLVDRERLARVAYAGRRVDADVEAAARRRGLLAAGAEAA